MRTVAWRAGAVHLIDQRALPWRLELLQLRSAAAVAESIANMTVRGAPAIGAAAAFGMALAAQESAAQEKPAMQENLQRAAELLCSARPTAVNLNWAVQRMLQRAEAVGEAADMAAALLAEAQRIADEDVAINRRMAAHGAALIEPGTTVLHHCNTGALATVDYGTALGVIRAAQAAGTPFHVLLGETRPRLQGARLSAWELERHGVRYDIIADTAAGYFMQRGEVDLVLVGADRVAANGDFANKIGTYQLAVLAAAHGIPFYTVAPTSTIDLSLPSGAQIPIEQRDSAELTAPYGHELVPAHFRARNPAFDVSPHRYLKGIVTENGIARPPFGRSLRQAVAGIAL